MGGRLLDVRMWLTVVTHCGTNSRGVWMCFQVIDESCVQIMYHTSMVKK